jgi:hypothetical protein
MHGSCTTCLWLSAGGSLVLWYLAVWCLVMWSLVQVHRAIVVLRERVVVSSSVVFSRAGVSFGHSHYVGHLCSRIMLCR